MRSLSASSPTCAGLPPPKQRPQSCSTPATRVARIPTSTSCSQRVLTDAPPPPSGRGVRPVRGARRGRLRCALGRRPVPPHRRHRRREDLDPRRSLLRPLRRSARRSTERQATPGRPGRRRRDPARHAGAQPRGPPVPHRALPRVAAAQEAWHRHHHPAGLGPALRAAWRDLAPALHSARRGGPPDHPPRGPQPHPVLSGGDAAPGPVPGVPAGEVRGAAQAVAAAVPDRTLRGRGALARGPAALPAPGVARPPRPGGCPGQPAQRGRRFPDPDRVASARPGSSLRDG